MYSKHLKRGDMTVVDALTGDILYGVCYLTSPRDPKLASMNEERAKTEVLAYIQRNGLRRV